MSRNDRAKEAQNQSQIDSYAERGPATMGPWTTHIWRSDPRHLAFLLARYKFCAKMLKGKSRVIEVGCGDAFGTPVVLQEVPFVHGIDFEPLVLEEARKCVQEEFTDRCTFSVHNIVDGPLDRSYDGAYSLDVIEHIPESLEDKFMANVCASLGPDSVFIIGTPNIEAARHASEFSQQGHINLKNGNTLRSLISKYFRNCFSFSMNDEVVHTGYSPMAHYLIGIGVGLK
jgi:2-polyprenyl-3-methyl-5-hydroxy-6-metoxy-1,4-benzoquinol methylase